MSANHSLFAGFIGLLGFLLFTSFAPAHEFHMSKCQIDYNEQEKALQISLHLFIDDLEDALKQGGGKPIHLCSEKETADAEEQLYAYLQSNFLLEVNEQAVSYNFIGKEQSEDLIGVWVYLEVTEVENLKDFSITNQLLVETFEDQKNITSVSVPPAQQKYFILQKGKTQESINYK